MQQAWKEWNEEDAAGLPKLYASVINPQLRAAVQAAWRNPSNTTETAVKALWTEVAPGVYSIPVWDMNKLPSVRTVLDTAAKAGIPTRPPYGIVLNRRGAMLDPRSVGYLAAPDWQAFYRMILNDYVRPLGRLFFAQDMMQHCGAALMTRALPFRFNIKPEEIPQFGTTRTLLL